MALVREASEAAAAEGTANVCCSACGSACSSTQNVWGFCDSLIFIGWHVEADGMAPVQEATEVATAKVAAGACEKPGGIAVRRWLALGEGLAVRVTREQLPAPYALSGG